MTTHYIKKTSSQVFFSNFLLKRGIFKNKRAFLFICICLFGLYCLYFLYLKNIYLFFLLLKVCIKMFLPNLCRASFLYLYNFFLEILKCPLFLSNKNSVIAPFILYVMHTRNPDFLYLWIGIESPIQCNGKAIT